MYKKYDSSSAKFAELTTRPKRSSSGQIGEAAQRVAAVFVLMLALTSGAWAAESQPDLKGVVNINTASAVELQLLPGVGEKRAAEIIGIRKSKGGFQSIDELVEVKGLGEAMLDRLRPHVTLKGKTTAHRL